MIQKYNQLAGFFMEHSIDVFDAYRTHLSPNGYFDEHAKHPTTKCGFLVALRGEAVFLYNGNRKFKMTSGKVFFGGSNKTLELKTGKEGFDYFLVHYMPNLNYSDINTVFEEEQATLLQSGLEAEMVQLMDKLFQTTELSENIMVFEKKILFLRLLHFVMLTERDQHLNKENSIISSACSYIQRNYMESLTLNELAVRYNLTPKYFSYLFQRQMGISPITYLIQYRMNKAYELLVHSSSYIHEIALCVGYTDAYYFSRLFKKHKGLTPTEARRRATTMK